MSAPVKPVKLAYVQERDSDFIRWTSNLLRRFLDEGSVVLTTLDGRPDAVLHSVWKKFPLPRDVPAILVSNENWELFPPHAPLQEYRAVLGLYPPAEPCTFIPYPFAAVYHDVPVEQLYRLRDELLQIRKTRFCCFVSSNVQGDLAPRRMGLFHELSRRQQVDAGGRVLNNIGYLAPRGLDFLRWIAQYKYMICLENTKTPGYITEKPFQPWFAGTVPIYDGGCLDRLNPAALVSAARNDVIAQLQALDIHPAYYDAKRRAPLSNAPLSLDGFEDQFRALIREIAAGN